MGTLGNCESVTMEKKEVSTDTHTHTHLHMCRNTEELSVLSDVTPSKENVAAPQHRLLTNSQQPLTSHQARVGKATLTQKENTTKVRSNVNHEEEGLRRCQHGVQQISRPLWKKARVQLVSPIRTLGTKLFKNCTLFYCSLG